MNTLLGNIQISVNPNLYLKNPESSDLGKRILAGGLPLMEELGFEDFTFKKLAVSIKSTEASIYRYFESKHYFLLYLNSWYWSWMGYRLTLVTTNIENPNTRLANAVRLLTEEVIEDGNVPHINEILLHKILIGESSTAYTTKSVDEANKLGAYKKYKELVQRICDIILEINPSYKYPHMLVSTVIEGSHHQRFFSEHLPKLTDSIEGEDAIVSFYSNMVFQSITTDEA